MPRSRLAALNCPVPFGRNNSSDVLDVLLDSVTCRCTSLVKPCLAYESFSISVVLHATHPTSHLRRWKSHASTRSTPPSKPCRWEARTKPLLEICTSRNCVTTTDSKSLGACAIVGGEQRKYPPSDPALFHRRAVSGRRCAGSPLCLSAFSRCLCRSPVLRTFCSRSLRFSPGLT